MSSEEALIYETDLDFHAAVGWARKLLQDDNFIILDTETTGLDKQTEICQIALFDGEKEILNSLVKPTVEISEESTAIHGITNELVKDAPSFQELLIPILRAVGQKEVAIYNAEFDLKLFQQSLKPYGIYLAFPRSDRRGCRLFLNGGSIHCVMQWYSRWVGEWSHRYDDYKWQSLPGGNHSAIGDCKATFELIKKMAE
jgi:DNA polymerase III subunit epsilon